MDENEIVAQQVVFSDGRRLDEVIDGLISKIEEIKSAVSTEINPE